MTDSIYKQHIGLLSPWVDGMRTKKVAAHIPAGSRVLDVGCGSGLLIKALPAGCSYVGVDRDPSIILVNRERFPACEFHCFDASREAFPFQNQGFDVVALAALIEHVDQTDQMFREIGRVLKKGGHAVLTTPSRGGGWVHHLLSSLGLLSCHAAEEHRGYWDEARSRVAAAATGLRLARFEKFQLGLNQLIIYKQGDPHE
ncbi:MAG: class I SAM-dependent methyltransferase [Elusimicrobia bacterium]|nr:class I SAM-dependent methyltransferase [Candidatus Obscuribacterium magneticum]